MYQQMFPIGITSITRTHLYDGHFLLVLRDVCLRRLYWIPLDLSICKVQIQMKSARESVTKRIIWVHCKTIIYIRVRIVALISHAEFSFISYFQNLRSFPSIKRERQTRGNVPKCTQDNKTTKQSNVQTFQTYLWCIPILSCKRVCEKIVYLLSLYYDHTEKVDFHG